MNRFGNANKLTLKSVQLRYPWIIPVFFLMTSYALWIMLYQLLIKTIVTFILQPQSPKLQDLSEMIDRNTLLIAGSGSLLFVLALRLLYPLVSWKVGELWDLRRMLKTFPPYFILGVFSAFFMLAAMLLSGQYYWVGLLFSSEETLETLFSILIRSLAIIAFIYCEEYLFRQRLLSYLKNQLSPIHCALIISIPYCLIKDLQFGFDLGKMHLFTLFLLSIAVTLVAWKRDNFLPGAGLWSGALWTFHLLASQPIFGNESVGMILIRYQSTVANTLLESVMAQRLDVFISGGVAGPLSSFALQAVIMLYLGMRMLRYRQARATLQAGRSQQHAERN